MKKPCVACGKQIPDAALHCVFCGVKQAELDASGVPVSVGEAQRSAEAAEAPTAASADGATATASPAAAAEAAPRTSGPMPSKGDVTLMGLRVADIEAAAQARTDAPPLDPTPVRGLPVLEEGAPAAQGPFSALVRLVMASGGVVLIALFSLPWHGASSWQLLETLAGADFVRQLFFLAGGAVLLAAAVLPVPTAFRATVGAVVAALPLVLGAEGLLDGWRGVGAALAIIALPATHLMRTRGAALDRTARALVVAAAIAVAALYLVPGSSVVPLVYVGRMLGSMSVAHTVLGLFIAIPLVLAALSLLGALGRDLASAAVLLAVLTLLWAPAAVLIFIGDGTQLYLALALLWTSATCALCVAQLLTLAAASAARRA